MKADKPVSFTARVAAALGLSPTKKTVCSSLRLWPAGRGPELRVREYHAWHGPWMGRSSRYSYVGDQGETLRNDGEPTP